jgi:hypothetical protein
MKEELTDSHISQVLLHDTLIYDMVTLTYNKTVNKNNMSMCKTCDMSLLLQCNVVCSVIKWTAGFLISSLDSNLKRDRKRNC